uniref:CMP/dCMP-type deaminase domain-containing protein n=1 Tax=viral metagenome TaxID=1070528 RepID=A0A6C0IZU2_9ZZZZ
MKCSGDCLQDTCKRFMKKKHINYFHIASIDAQKSNMHKNFGAVIVYNNKIIGIGHNHSIDYYTRTHNYINKERKILQNVHAENDAIINAIKNGNKKLLSKSDIYISRILNDYDNYEEYNFQTSPPCENCRKLIEKYKIKKAYYMN